jgi:hypothetical protein
VTEKPHRRGDHDEVREWRCKAATTRANPGEIDFGDKISHDRRADKNLSRAASTFFNVL